MSGAVLVGNGAVVTAFGGADARVLTDGAAVWDGDRILAVGPEADLRRQHPGATFLDAHGGLICPGLINLHHHFYSALARGLDPQTPMRDFPEILDRLWWRLDRALDPDTVGLSAELSVLECIRWGCTTVFDHHASPNCIGGSLDLIASAVAQGGLSAVLCYEITDRNGPAQARAGLEENLAFIEAHADDPRVRGLVGLHASFTLRNDTLQAVATRRPGEAGCHIHAGEDPVDITATREAFGTGPVERLAEFGLLDDRCLLAHGIHLSDADYQRVGSQGAVILHNPESNAHNGVGRLDVPAVMAHGCTVGLGTDGMSSSVLRSLRAAFLMQRASGDPTTGFTAIPTLLENNARVARRFFDEPLLGVITPGAPADLIVVDAPPPTPIAPDNLFAHLVYGATDAGVRHTIARGQLLLEDFRPSRFDPEEVSARARLHAPALWERFHALPWGTSFLG